MTGSTERASPLSGWSERFRAASAEPQRFSIREIPFATQVNLRGNAGDTGFLFEVGRVLKCELPRAANTWMGGESCTVLWLGPDEWLVVAPDGHAEKITSDLREALKSRHHSVTDLSANRTLIELTGSDARMVLAKGCPLDLHAGAFKPPQCAQSVLAKSQVILQCVEPEPVFRLFVRLSFAAYVAEWLLDAAAECAAARPLDSDKVATRLA